jgi:hypothetical protein
MTSLQSSADHITVVHNLKTTRRAKHHASNTVWPYTDRGIATPCTWACPAKEPTLVCQSLLPSTSSLCCVLARVEVHLPIKDSRQMACKTPERTSRSLNIFACRLACIFRKFSLLHNNSARSAKLCSAFTMVCCWDFKYVASVREHTWICRVTSGNPEVNSNCGRARTDKAQISRRQHPNPVTNCIYLELLGSLRVVT